MATVLTVLRSGGEFNATHVQAMQRQVERWAPAGTRFVCISDAPIDGVECYALQHDWPGWWCKLEMFRPDVLPGEDFLFTDLDNVIVGPINDLLQRPRSTIQRGGWTALMYLKPTHRERVWDEFIKLPKDYMWFYAKENRPVLNGIGNYGDAGFISTIYGGIAQQWEEALPGQVINIVDLRVRTILGLRAMNTWPPDTRVVLCGGTENRPWKLKMFWKYRLYGENI
jgi:hypothetical protein